MSRDLRHYLLFQVFFGLLLWLPIFYNFQIQIGLNDNQIFGIQSIYYLAFIFFELPTGFIGDKFGYRKSLILGGLTLLVSNLLPSIYPSYSGMLSHFLLIAASRALISGSASAYLYEYLKKNDTSDQYQKIEGESRFWSLIVKIGCWPLAGYLMDLNIYLPYWLTAFSAGAALFFAYSLPHLDESRDTLYAQKNPIQSIFTAAKILFKSRHLLLLILQGGGIFVLVRILQVHLFQPILSFHQVDVVYFGWVMSGMTTFEAFGSLKSSLLSSYFSRQNSIAILSIAMCVCLIGISLIHSHVGIFCFLGIFALCAGLAFPIQKQLVNDAISTSNRALILSMESIFDRCLCSAALLPMGYLLANNRLNFLILLVCAAVIALIFTVQIFLLRLTHQSKIKN